MNLTWLIFICLKSCSSLSINKVTVFIKHRYCLLCCGSALISMGIRIEHFRPLRIRIQIQGFDDYNWKRSIFLWETTEIYLYLGLHKGSPSYRRSLQPSKENIQHFKTWNFSTFFYYYGLFLPSWIHIRIRIQSAKLIADTYGSGTSTLLFYL